MSLAVLSPLLEKVLPWGATARDPAACQRLKEELSYEPVEFAVDANTVIAVGDILYLDTDDVKPAADQPDQLSEANNQVLFASKFAGIALQAHAAGTAGTIRVATAGVHTIACASSTWEVGDLFGTDEHANGTQLLSQAGVKVTTTDVAIGRCVARSAAATTVQVRIASTVCSGGVMPPS